MEPTDKRPSGAAPQTGLVPPPVALETAPDYASPEATFATLLRMTERSLHGRQDPHRLFRAAFHPHGPLKRYHHEAAQAELCRATLGSFFQRGLTMALGSVKGATPTRRTYVTRVAWGRNLGGSRYSIDLTFASAQGRWLVWDGPIGNLG